MDIAMVSSPVRGDIDRLLTGVSQRLQAKGVVLAGIVKAPEHMVKYENGCDMSVRVLPDGPVIQITQDLGKGSDACRLDPGAIATAVSTVEASALQGADLFILNKFGPEEAAGRGFRVVIGAALELGIPVLTGVGLGVRDAFETFAGGMATTLPPEDDAIEKWCLNAITNGSRQT